MADDGGLIQVDRLSDSWYALSDDPGQRFITDRTKERVRAGELPRYIKVTPEIFSEQSKWCSLHEDNKAPLAPELLTRDLDAFA